MLTGLRSWTNRQITGAKRNIEVFNFYRKNRDSIPQLSEADPDQAHGDFGYYRQLGTAQGAQVTPQTQEKLIKVSRHLTTTNGIARRCIQLSVDYVLGSGFNPTAKDDTLQDFLHEYWYGYGNQWDIEQFPWYANLLRDGEMIALAHTNAVNQVAWSWVDPLWVESVLPQSTMPGGGRMDRAGLLRLKQGCEIQLADGKELSELTVIRPDNQGHLQGDCAFFAINQAPGSMRGLPEITPVVDWTIYYNYFLTQVVESSAIQNSLVWDILFKQMEQKEIDAQLAAWPKKFEPGQLFGHNENVEMKPAAHNYGQSYGMAKQSDIIMEYILGGWGFPRHFFAHSGEGNRATSVAQGDPTFKSLESKQRQYKQMHMHMLDFALDQAAAFKQWDDEARMSVAFECPPIDVQDIPKIAGTSMQLASSLSLATMEGWVTPAQAADVYVTTLQPLGADIEAAEDIPDTVDKDTEEPDKPQPVPGDDEAEQEAVSTYRQLWAGRVN